jgi:hypothetical protein
MALKAELQRMIAACARGRVADCRVIGALQRKLPGDPYLAMPVKSGQRWSTSVIGIPLEEISVEFS